MNNLSLNLTTNQINIMTAQNNTDITITMESQDRLDLTETLMESQGMTEGTREVIKALMQATSPEAETEDRIEGGEFGVYARRNEHGTYDICRVEHYNNGYMSRCGEQVLQYCNDSKFEVESALRQVIECIKIGISIGHEEGYKDAQLSIRHSLGIAPNKLSY